MFSPPPAVRAGKRAAFTLLELLIVIVIIAVLTALLFSVAGSVQNSSKKVAAVNDMRSIKTAILTYYNDYRKYPLNDLQYNAGVVYALGDTVYGDPVNPKYTSADLFDILRAVADGNYNQDDHLNANGTVYWAGPYAKSATKPRSGITTQDSTSPSGNAIPKGSLVDPWGNSYVVFFDADNDGNMTQVLGYFYTEYDPTKGGTSTYLSGSPPLGIAICSLGPDGVFGSKVNGQSNGHLTGSDDITTWQ